MNKYAAYFALEKKLKALGYPFHRSELIFQHTKGQKQSLTELSHIEYTELIKHMQALIGEREHGKADRMRKKIISLFRHMGYEWQVGTTQVVKADMDRINRWCEKYGKFHKPLNHHNLSELAQLTTQAEQVYASYLQEIDKTRP